VYWLYFKVFAFTPSRVNYEFVASVGAFNYAEQNKFISADYCQKAQF